MTKLSNLGLLSILAASSFACSVDRTKSVDTGGYYFTGWVYDGVSNARLGDGAAADYKLSLSFAKKNLKASVGGTGKFWVGPLEPFHDYTVTITADGYRPFYASQSFLTSAARGSNGMQSQLFEAYVFPDDIASPELTFTIETPDGTLPSGFIRATPNADVGESAINLQGDVDGSVDGQVWENDADRKFETVTKPVDDGVVTFDAGELVYGVTYQASVYGAEGGAFQAFMFTAGLTGNQTVVLPRLTEQALAITANSLNTDEDGLDENGTVVLTFNQDIQLSALFDETSVFEAVDDSFTIASPDADADGETNALITDDEDDVQERGTHVDIDGNKLTLSWDRADEDFDSGDADDPILSATYDISSIRLRPVDGRTDQEVTLASLLGAAGPTTITVQVDPRPF